jgi:predicted nuclease of predicted toxin-antitoxin system
MIRFHLDEHVAYLVANGLRRYGFDVTTPEDVDLLGAEDAAHLTFALSDGRVLATHDDDFLRLHAAGLEHAGIAFCHANKYTPSQLRSALRIFGECFTEAEMRGRVEHV